MVAQAEVGSFLGVLSGEDADDLRRRGRTHSYAEGGVVFHEGDVGDSVALLLSGRVKVTAHAGGTESVLAIRGPGDLLGELSALDEEPRSATVTALEPVEAMVLAAAEFRRYLADRPGIALMLLRTLSRRLRESARRDVEFAAFDTVGRVSARLAELCDRYGEEGEGGVDIDVPMTQEELAGLVGASVEATKKALHTLRSAGWIRTGRRHIAVLDRESLVRRSR